LKNKTITIFKAPTKICHSFLGIILNKLLTIKTKIEKKKNLKLINLNAY